MQHCEECGAELPNNALFCGRCGRKATSEDEITTHENSGSIENMSESPTSIELALNDSQDTISGNEEEQQEQTPVVPSENEAEAEEQTSYVISEYENEEQIHKHYLEETDLMPDDVTSEQKLLANQFPDEQPQSKNPIEPLETERPFASSQKSASRSGSRCLLFSLAGLIVTVGIVVVLMSLFRLNILGFGGSSNAQSSSSKNEIINPNGSSLTASICVKTLTPSSSASNQGSTLILVSSSGCSTVTASKIDSSCLIFPITPGASRKYIVDVSNASIESKSYHLVLGVVDYTGPTTFNDARHISIGLSEGSTGRNFSWLYHSGSVIINSDEQSGTMDVILEAVNGGHSLHIVGDWACGRQLKTA